MKMKNENSVNENVIDVLLTFEILSSLWFFGHHNSSKIVRNFETAGLLEEFPKNKRSTEKIR